jgi:hypothetical protein
MPDVATLRLSREQNQARLNYAEAEQGRPKINLILCDKRRFPRRYSSFGHRRIGYSSHRSDVAGILLYTHKQRGSA